MRTADPRHLPAVVGPTGARILIPLLALITGCSGRDSDSARGAAPGGAPEWSAPIAITAARGGAAPVFATSPSGRLTLAWVSAPDNGKDGRLTIRPDANAEATAELHDPLGGLSAYGEVPPKIAYAPDGALYAAYLVTRAVPGRKWPENAMRFATSRDGGSTWSTPITVTATAAGDSVFGSYDDHALHVAPDGSLVISWLAATGMSSHTYFVRSTDAGASWTRPAMVDVNASCPCCRTAMTSAPDGALYVAWRKIYPAPKGQTEIRDIAVARSDDQGKTWGAPVRVHPDDWNVNYCPDAGPSIKVGADNVLHVAWWTGKEGHAGVQYAHSTDRGVTFTAPVPLGVAQFSRAAHVQLALGTGVNAGVVLAAWDDGTRKVSQIVTRLSRDGGLTFADAQPLSTSDVPAGYPVVSLRGDTAIVAWQERSLAAAAADSAAHAKLDPNSSDSYINAVGALRVVARRMVMPHGKP